LSQRVTTSRWTSTPTPVWVSFDGWLRYEGIAIAPSDAVSVKLEVSANQLNGYAFFDNVKVDEFDPGDTIYRSTYGLAGQPIATRIVTSPSDPNDGIYYIHTDHLGSVSAMSDGSSGALVGDIIRFDPFGDYRPGSGAGDITDRGFTGHKHNDYIGLVYMVGRYYIQSIGRFASPDSIIPQTFNPQSLNRYSYVQNSPLNRIDPTGHEDICDDPLQCNEPPPSPPPIPTGPLVTFSVEEGCTSTITAVCNWSQAEMDAITQAALDTGVRLAETINAANPGWNLSPEEAFMLVYGGSINFRKTDDTSASGAWGETFLRGGRHEIDVYTDAYYDDGSSGLVDSRWAVHEFGHAFINVVGRSPLLFLDIIQGYDDNFPDRPLTPNARDGTWGFAGPRWGWQRSDQGRTSEEFADMFLGWVYNTWELGDAGGFSDDGQARADFMNYFMPYWTGWAID
jgi:RHS repeat-associated protein